MEEIIIKEEVSWNQKVKIKGVREWDNNSKLFHRVASGRKANKMINKIEGKDGQVLFKEEEIVKEIVSFFEDLYKKRSIEDLGIEGLEWARINVRSKERLERPFEEEEVKSALFSCDGDKAPGPDGFSMAALQENWHIIKGDIMEVFREFFDKGVVNARTNATYICLIPKKLNSICIKDFRPISLVTSLYKVMAKVLSLRVKEVLEETIDNSQGAFVQGRQILDLVLIANEVVEEYRSKKKQGLVVKIDFEKAYDHVSWEFLDYVLEKKGFGNRWRKWIWGCLSSANFSVIVNGRPRGHFGASRGLRQGDPLSPFLFILVGDVLSRLVKKACDNSLVEGFEIGSKKVRVSHLQFADDSIFFVANKDESLENLIKVMDLFSLLAGLKINMSKSVAVGINVEQDRVDNIANKLGCSKGEWPLTYLGLPLGGNPNKVAFWDPVVERIIRRLDGWHRGCLSRGGRLVLLQSVLCSIPTYYLSIFKMPIKVSCVIEKLMRDFFWEGKGEGKRDHLVRWDVVTKPKNQGGLGVGNLINKNMALLGKWLWRFPLENKSLWFLIIESKYGIHPNGWDTSVEFKASLRSPWKAIVKGWNRFVENTKLVVGKGDRIRFWEDVWVGNRPLKESFPRLYRLSLNRSSLIKSVLVWSSSLIHHWDLKFSKNFNDRDCDEFVKS